MRLGLLTGARLDELCSLRCENVLQSKDGFSIRVVEGKTENARRIVPIHPRGSSIIQRRLGQRGSDWLFSGLTPGGPDKKRSWNVSKAFGRFRQHVGVTARRADFHALRHNFAEALEAAGVVRDTRELLMGHKREGVAFVYAKGGGVDLRDAIMQLDYGAEVMELIGRP